MSTLNNRIVIEMVRGVKAFLNLEAGLTRGKVPVAGDSRVKDEKIGQLQKRVTQLEGWIGAKDDQINALRQKVDSKDTLVKELRASNNKGSQARLMDPSRLVWIFCASRSGSTWLYNMLDDMKSYEAWHEPLIGSLLGDFYKNNSHRGGKHYIFGGDREDWLKPVRSFILEAATIKFPATLKGKYLAVKEPSSAVGAPIIMEALPESSLIMLLRDPRDVAASSLDAYQKGSWFRERREKAGQAWIAKQFADADENPDVQVKRVSKKYLRQMSKAKEAYDNHEGPKVIVKYEDLVEDTLGVLKRAHDELGIPVDEQDLARVVEKRSWDNIPEEQRGQGKFYRKGQPGSWREDLTAEQVGIVEEITRPLLSAYYPDVESEASR